MDAISGTRRAMKEMADGTIRVQVDIDPACRAIFLQLFPNIDMPVALAPLRADFERQQPDTAPPGSDRPKGGELARLAGIFSNNPTFQDWCEAGSAEEAAEWIRRTCQVSSRADLDHDEEAQKLFHNLVRLPFVASRQ